MIGSKLKKTGYVTLTLIECNYVYGLSNGTNINDVE